MSRKDNKNVGPYRRYPLYVERYSTSLPRQIYQEYATHNSTVFLLFSTLSRLILVDDIIIHLLSLSKYCRVGTYLILPTRQRSNKGPLTALSADFFLRKYESSFYGASTVVDYLQAALYSPPSYATSKISRLQCNAQLWALQHCCCAHCIFAL